MRPFGFSGGKESMIQPMREVVASSRDKSKSKSTSERASKK